MINMSGGSSQPPYFPARLLFFLIFKIPPRPLTPGEADQFYSHFTQLGKLLKDPCGLQHCKFIVIESPVNGNHNKYVCSCL